jgi:hypothetical protein
MNKKTYSQILDAVAHDQIPEGLDLAPHILSRVQKGKGTTMQPRARALLIVILILLVLAVASVSVPAVRATIQRWLGYVPGFGLVQDGNVRVLAGPVSVTQGGFTLTVNEAILSSTKTVVKYTVEGVSTDMLVEIDPCRLEQVHPVMRLPDGSELEPRGFGTQYSTDPNSPAHYGGEATFSSMPADTNDAILVIGCLPGNWEVPLHFVAAPPEMTIAPVLDVTPVTGQSAFEDGLVLDKIIPTQGGYILAGTITLTPPEGYTVDESDGYLEDVTITDANGLEVAYGPAPDDFIPEELALQPEGTYGWACQIYGEEFSWPLTMTVRSVTALSAPYPPTEFQFDAGPDPQVDQVWTLNQDVALGPGTVHVLSVQRIQQDYGFDGYEFTFEYDPSVDFSLEIQGHVAMGGGGRGPNPAGTYSKARSYPDGIPSGTLTVVLNGYGVVHLPGPWEVTWDLPAETGAATSTP